jgi:hypothetical protein
MAAGLPEFLDDFLMQLKEKKLELTRDEESYGNSLNEEDCGYLVEKYKASLDYFIQDLQAAVDRLPHNNAGNAVNADPEGQRNPNANNARNNPSGGRRKKRTRKSRK